MIAAYIIFSLDIVNSYFFNAVFIKQVLEVGSSYTFIGFSGSCYAFICFGWKPIAGSLSDKKGPSKLLTLCLFGGLVGTISAYCSTSLLFLFLCKLIFAFSSPIQILVRSIIANTGSENPAENLSKLGIVSAISLICSALICGELLEHAGGMQYIYTLLVINFVINIILTQILSSTEESKIKNESQATLPALEEVTSALSNFKKLSTSETYWDIFLLKALAALSFGIVDTNALIVLLDRDITGRNIGYLITTIFLIMFITNIFQVKINNLFYKNDVGYHRIWHASFVITLSLLIQGFSSNKWIFAIFVNIMTICRCIVDNSMMEILLIRVNNAEKATVLGSFDSIQSLTDLMAPIISSLFLEFSGISTVYLVSAILFVLESSVALRGKTKIVNVKPKMK